MMRVITGKARGTRLSTLEGENTRPTSERVKEAIFSIIQFEIAGKKVLDLFAGSGQMGIEALSRGAISATFVDGYAPANAVVKLNVTKTHFEKESEIILSDAVQYLKKMAGKKKFSLVFVDPPYASGLVIESLKCLIEYGMLEKNAIVICESGSENIFENEGKTKEKFEIIKQSRYSISYVTVLKYTEEKCDE